MDNYTKICGRCKEEKNIILFSKAKSCKFGVNSICKQCISISDKKRRESNIELYRKKEREKYYKDPKKASQNVMKSARKHREKIREKSRIYYLKNKDRINKLRRENNLKNPSPKREQRTRREAAKIKATPNWLTEEHIFQIQKIYSDAFSLEQEDGNPRQVDHIIPLRHPEVCGLHVPWNLQILNSSDNCRKSNRFDGTYENKSWIKLIDSPLCTF